jgi:hypothetical protein
MTVAVDRARQSNGRNSRDLDNLCSSLDITEAIQSRRFRMEKKNVHKILFGKTQEGTHVG